MRQTWTGMVAALAVMTAGAAPAMACGYSTCSPCGGGAYVSPCAQTYVPTYGYSYTGCGTCGGWGYQRLAEPTTQYYYANQGPTYTGPGAFAPYPTYRESAPYYGTYRYPRYHHNYRPWHDSYVPDHRHVRYGYAPYTFEGRRVLRRYY